MRPRSFAEDSVRRLGRHAASSVGAGLAKKNPAPAGAPIRRVRGSCLQRIRANGVIRSVESANLDALNPHPSMSSPSGLSACIITLNEADRIDACLDSLAFCDDVVVVDSGSTDDTRERATARGARVLVRKFDGYRSQKDYAVGMAANDWVLCLDADERVTPALRAEIERERD